VKTKKPKSKNFLLGRMSDGLTIGDIARGLSIPCISIKTETFSPRGEEIRKQQNSNDSKI